MASRRIGPPEEEIARIVFGVQPVHELISHRPRDVERVFVARQPRGAAGHAVRMARQLGIPVTNLTPERLAAKVGGRARHQGIAAQVAHVPYAEADEVCEQASRKRDGLLVLVDRVTDAGNLGAILRTCAAAGVDGVLLSSEGTVGLTPHVAKASAGAVERVPVAREARPPRRIEQLRERGFRALVLDAQGGTPWDEVDLLGQTVIVAGGEEDGPRPGLLKVCDTKVAIPLERGVESLNVAVATAVLLFEARRQRRGVIPSP
jgi:23S rRNA (guanosine2251-2'-O)-methyltransferase